MSNVKLMLLPTVQGRKLSKIDGQPLSKPYIYRSTVGALQYLTHTRPDITYDINQLSRFLQTPTDIHWQAAKRVLRYISDVKHYGLYFQPNPNLHISAYSDVDWASNLDDRKSGLPTVHLEEITSSHGPQGSKQWSQGRVQNMNIEHLPMPHLRSSGFNNY
ncbi:uncharacterized mitochondrial protein AtMg00240-like [Benincasa hispida]|uniref:uncharacterized mitochondrial protein AtMg00240-like n=1 Tax=Benincasa hispida TaxID=102211 RepID=UPI001901FA3E|nr:uncharacterized mitochondrial protein AtMg00240-like [Benincasa hispida]